MRAALAARGRVVALGSPLAIVASAAIALGIALRFFARPNLPLWLDEAWTGAIVAQDSLGETLRQSLLDANAPLYFALVHVWSSLFGLSNDALRFPSLMFGTLAPFLALVPIKGLRREARYLWCALLALWFPGILYSQEARCYTMVLFLAMASSLAYARLLAQPDLRRALLWAALGSLAILTHYHALVLIGLQGLAYLALHRGRALRTWPAALVFAPAFAWLAVHLPHVAEFTDPRVAWFDQLGLNDIPGLAVFVLGGPLVALGLVAVAMVALALRSVGPDAGPDAGAKTSSQLWIVIATAGLGAAFVVSVAMLSTSFAPRYLIPFIPGLMLGIALAATRGGPRPVVIPLAVALVFAGSAVSRGIGDRNTASKLYNFQTASDTLMAAGVRNLTFLWDNPLNAVWDRDQLGAVGGFFFQRAGIQVAVDAIRLSPGQDPNERLVAAASGRPKSGILWLYDREVRGTVAASFPPRIEERDPAWQCRQFGANEVGVVACVRP